MAGIKDHASVTDAAVTTAINDAAEQLKDVAIERRVVRNACKPLYPDRNALLNIGDGKPLPQRVKEDIERHKAHLAQVEESLEQIVTEQTTQVNQSWDTRKFDLIPGDLFLDQVFKSFSVRFNKDRDSARLAALMIESEIHQEIRDLLEDIGGV